MGAKRIYSTATTVAVRGLGIRVALRKTHDFMDAEEWLHQHGWDIYANYWEGEAVNPGNPLVFFFRDEALAFAFKMRWG
jgi:hypothetical protein